MELSTEYEERFFKLIDKSPATYALEGLNEDDLVKYREYELQDMSQALFSGLKEFKEEVLRNATFLLQTGAHERTVYLQALLNRTENSNIEIANMKDVGDFVEWMTERDGKGSPKTKYNDLKKGITQRINFFNESNASLKLLRKFISAELAGKPHQKYFAEPRNPIQKENTKNTFKDLFITSSDYDKAIETLKNVSPPIINSKGEYCYGKAGKSSMSAYIDVLRSKGKISNLPPDNILAEILNKQFPNLNFDKTGRTLRAKNTRAYKKYRPLFESLIK